MARRRRAPRLVPSLWAAESDRDWALAMGNDPDEGYPPRPRPRCRFCKRIVARPETEAAMACIPPCPPQIAAQPARRIA